MARLARPWEYLIVTASNDRQAAAYRSRLDLERELGLLSSFRHIMVVADPGGKRIGSGGSTVLCLREVLNRELAGSARPSEPQACRQALSNLRILIIHAGGDSKRVPAYSASGKILTPLPIENDTAIVPTLLDRQLPVLRDLPAMPAGAGQTVVTCGDALLDFDPGELRWAPEGMTFAGCRADPEIASRHGVYCADADGRLTLYLQKPGVREQRAAGAIDSLGQSILDIGVMNMAAAAALALMNCLGTTTLENILANGFDLYSEVCGALGTHSTPEHHRRVCRGVGSRWTDAELERFHAALSDQPASVRILSRCGFLHFGATRQLLASGAALVQLDRGPAPTPSRLLINTRISGNGQVVGDNCWIDGCEIRAPLTLGGRNVVTNVAVDAPVRLPNGACLTVLRGRTSDAAPFRAILCYGVDDEFKDTPEQGATFCNRPVLEWLQAVGATREDLWAADAGPRTLWEARVFPIVDDGGDTEWLWMFHPEQATPEQKEDWRNANRQSLAEIVPCFDEPSHTNRQSQMAAATTSDSLDRLFALKSNFSAAELAWTLRLSDDRGTVLAKLLNTAQSHFGDLQDSGGIQRFVSCRILHTLATALENVSENQDARLSEIAPGVFDRLAPETEFLLDWMNLYNLAGRNFHEQSRMQRFLFRKLSVREWAVTLRRFALRKVQETILFAAHEPAPRPRLALRPDETVWGRAPARLELGGGWTDTPPFTLEHGGAVINAAVNLNGQPPIHCYARIRREPIIRLNSIDLGESVTIETLDQLMDFRHPEDGFALVKAALAIAGFSPVFGDPPAGASLRETLREFGGGLEITTLAGIPKGSGLGASSIVGAAVVGVLHRVLGRPIDRQAIFREVLRLEQALTTGGGWQDQAGGGFEGTKLTTTQPGLFPVFRPNFVPSDLLDPQANGGATLLYYTGLTRLAKNILERIVGGYLDRNRAIMQSLADEFKVAEAIYGALSRKDAAEFGHDLDEAWRLQKQLCPEVTNETIEELLARIRPRVHGARILGAGSGGFLLMVGKSPREAAAIRDELEARPLNDRSRFFEYSISTEGLVVTSC